LALQQWSSEHVNLTSHAGDHNCVVMLEHSDRKQLSARTVAEGFGARWDIARWPRIVFGGQGTSCPERA